MCLYFLYYNQQTHSESDSHEVIPCNDKKNENENSRLASKKDRIHNGIERISQDNHKHRQESRNSRNSQQLGRQASDGDASQRAHRRNESDSRIGLLRRQHTDLALARRSEMYRNSKIELTFGGNASDAPSPNPGEPILTDFAPIRLNDSKNSQKNHQDELRRQTSLDGDLHRTGSPSSARDFRKPDRGQRREKTDVESRKAELRSELDRRRINAEGKEQEEVSISTNNQQVSWEQIIQCLSATCYAI